jgi:N-methylhydantoinase A/oxoprolinase/acetone carboxylase beta subunit
LRTELFSISSAKSEDKSRDITFKAELNNPVIGVGAPVQAYLPGAVARLSGKFVQTEHSDVANAAGTVNGLVIERVRVLIKPGETGGYFVYGPEGRHIMRELQEAEDYAENTAEKEACKRAELAGGAEIMVEVQRKENYLPLSDQSAEGADLFIECVIEAEARGRPW